MNTIRGVNMFKSAKLIENSELFIRQYCSDYVTSELGEKFKHHVPVFEREARVQYSCSAFIASKEYE